MVVVLREVAKGLGDVVHHGRLLSNHEQLLGRGVGGGKANHGELLGETTVLKWRSRRDCFRSLSIAFGVALFSQLGHCIGLVKQFVKTFFSDHDGFIAPRARDECARAHTRMHARVRVCV